jgi:hypothetical protein
MTDPLEQTLARIASLAPTPLATQRALASVEKKIRARRRRWIVPLSLAAALLLLLASLLPLLFPARLSAAERLGQALDTTQAYKGWIRISSKAFEQYLDTQTHTQVLIQRSQYNDTANTRIDYQNPATGEWSVYASRSNSITLSSIPPAQQDELHLQADILSFSHAQLLHRLNDLNVDVSRITAQPDAGLDRYDIAPAIAAATQHRNFGDTPIPATLWVDPRTRRIAQYIVDDVAYTVSYDCPVFTSIYAAGAPRSAKIIDLRPSPEAIAAVARIHQRQTTPFPKGLSLFLEETSPRGPALLTVYGSAGDRWFRRQYPVRTSADPDPAKLDLPAHWNTAATDELLRRLPTAALTSEMDGNPHLVVIRYFARHQETDYPNPVASDYAIIFAPPHFLYPLATNYSPIWKLDMITSPDRPGQVGLHFQHLPQATHDYWIDPAHADRFITRIETTFDTSSPSKIQSRTVTDFSNYQSLPAPDSRAYPTTWTQTLYTPDATGTLTPTQHQTTTFLFLPDKSLPMPDDKTQ